MIGILALQGAFVEHAHILDKLGMAHKEIRDLHDLTDDVDGLIFPGGESTTMGRLLRDLKLLEPLKKKIEGGTPVLGTCAGLILLAKDVIGGVPCFGTMDICVRRNAYGRQLGSFWTKAEVKGIGEIPMTFIRAPYIESVGPAAETLAVVDGHIVAARQGNQFVTAFHPELDEEVRLHQAVFGK
jgi:pyridoxal 5'-phosphate synthase pdxT subunit